MCSVSFATAPSKPRPASTETASRSSASAAGRGGLAALRPRIPSNEARDDEAAEGGPAARKPASRPAAAVPNVNPRKPPISAPPPFMARNVVGVRLRPSAAIRRTAIVLVRTRVPASARIVRASPWRARGPAR